MPKHFWFLFGSFRNLRHLQKINVRIENFYVYSFQEVVSGYFRSNMKLGSVFTAFYFHPNLRTGPSNTRLERLRQGEALLLIAPIRMVLRKLCYEYGPCCHFLKSSVNELYMSCEQLVIRIKLQMRCILWKFRFVPIKIPLFPEL
jgi:hypothetical protein